jgi:ubiquinone/menaquinone biosynthesis C-methylase UbiE
VRVDDPDVVRSQYATETGLIARRSIYETIEGQQAPEVVFEAIAERAPARVLEVGCGPGELAQRVAEELGAEVVAVDISERMVELARGRGVDADVGDVQALSFEDASFDCVVAAWVLFHVPDLDRGVAEIARVLEPGGALVAATNGERHLDELWALVGERSPGAGLSFRTETARAALEPHFAAVEQRNVAGWVTVDNPATARGYIASSVVRGHLAECVPDFDGPLRVGARSAVFVARKAA